MMRHEFPITRREWLGLIAGASLTPWMRAWSQEPPPDKQLIARTLTPGFNGEPPLDQLASSWRTPQELFFVRSHAPAPMIDPATYRLRIEGLVRQPHEFSLDELRAKFPSYTVSATLTCAGNRRTEFNTADAKIAGVQWGAGAIGHGEWSGRRLADVLKTLELMPGAKHIWFEGLDEFRDKTETTPFGGSIPLEKALSPGDDGTLLADQLNGTPLPAHHGFPLRTIVPGYIGARSVKWLGKITVSAEPSTNRFVARDYKLITDPSPETLQKSEPIREFVLNSAICTPQTESTTVSEIIPVRGYALPAGEPGRSIARVELSADAGRTWKEMHILSPQRPYSWVLWRGTARLKPGLNTLMVRAIDDQGHTQPATVPLNLKGYQGNDWHHVQITRV